ncbi:Predicted kinase [Synechococcus sp. RCC307]|nr:Predicted kinase [Synechococcus sp. RCC307]
MTHSALSLLQQWCRERSSNGDIVLGLCAPPGSGKSHLSRQIGSGVVAVSIDDLYWPQPKLQQHQRGLPGSHDVPRLAQLIDEFRAQGQTLVPRFDKTLAGGAGDRVDDQPHQGDQLLLEGWCIGARGLPSLQDYQAIWRRLDALLVLVPPTHNHVLRWRLQAEARQRRRGGGALHAHAVTRMVQSFYSALPPERCFQPLLDSPQLPTWSLKLDHRRRPIGSIQPCQTGVGSDP